MLRRGLLAAAGNQGVELGVELLGRLFTTGTGGGVDGSDGNVDGSSVTADDLIVIAYGGEGNGSGRTASFTVNGAAATVDEGPTSVGNGITAVASISAAGDRIGDSTLAIAVTVAGGTGFRSYMNVYRIINGASASVQASATDTDNVDTASSTLTTTTAVTAGDVLITAGYYSDDINHTLSINNGTITQNIGTSDTNGSGDSGFSTDASGSTVVTYTRRNVVGNTQGDSLSTVVYGV